MRGLVSFSLFGDDPNDVYYHGAIRNAQMYRQRFEDWDLWFYIGRSVPDDVLTEIYKQNPNAKFDFVDEVEDQTSTWWRFRAVKHSDHDFILFRDVDSRPFLRETEAVKEWLESPFPYHCMRDHQYHGRQLLAGLWGIKRESFPALRRMPDSISGDYYGTDQIELLTWVWPDCRRKIMTHIGCYHIFEKMDQRRPFRVQRTSKEPFVAQGLNANEQPRYPEHTNKVDADRELRRRPDIFLEEYRVPGEAAVYLPGRGVRENLFIPVEDE